MKFEFKPDPFAGIGGKPVIRIAKHNYAAICIFYAGISFRTDSFSWIFDHRNAVVFFFILLQYLGRAIGAVIVHTNELYVQQRLSKQTVQAFRQICFHIIDRNNKA